MDTSQEPAMYNVSMLVKFFHSFPHYDIRFDSVSSEFAPDNEQYRESLLLIAAVPVLWMILWILIYMIYFCYFCVTCRRRNIEKARKSVRVTRWCSFLFTILVIVSLTVAIFSNELIDTSLKSAHSDINLMKNRTDQTKIQSAYILRDIDLLNNETAAYLASRFNTNSVLDENDRPVVIGHTTIIRQALTDANKIFRNELQSRLTHLSIDNSQFSALLETCELYRRIASHAVSGYLMLTTALSLCALGSRKKAFILTCVAISICNVILVWIAAGFYAGLSVGTADLCVNATDYVLQSSKAKVYGDSNYMSYYLHCQPSVNPLHKVVVSVQNHIYDADNSFSEILKKSSSLSDEVKENITAAQRDLNKVKAELQELSSNTDCSSSSRYFQSAVSQVCETSMVGEVAILGSFGVVGIFLIILVFLLHTAARFNRSRKQPTLNVTTQPANRRRRRAYFEVDSQDHEFQSRGEHNRSDNPLYYRFSQISTTEDNTRVPATSGASAGAQPSAPPRSSPPPAYQNHKDFYSTYGNNGTLDSNTRVPAASNDLNRNSNTFRT